MSYYKPRLLAVLSFFVSFCNAVVMPLYGFIFSKILFVMLKSQSPDFNRDRNIWCGCFLIFAVCSAVIGFLEKYLFVYIGENLTFEFRK